jgi:hypothetical protein
MTSWKYAEYMFVVELEPQVGVACSRIALDLVENKMGLRVVRGTFEAVVGSLVVVDIMVSIGWYWVTLDPVYRLVLETFVKNLMTWLAYCVVTEVGERARIRVCFRLIAVSVLLVVVTCVYVLHYTSLRVVLRELEKRLYGDKH